MRNTLLLVLIGLSFSLGVSDSFAQRGRRGGRPGISLLNFNYEIVSPSGVGGLGLPNNPNLEVEVTTLSAGISLPPIGMRRRGGRDSEDYGERGGAPRWMILHSLGYHQHRADYQNLNRTSRVDQLDRVNGFEYKMNLVVRASPGWRVVAQVNPGLYSDLEGDITSSHWKVGAGLLLDRTFGNGLTFGLGIVWSTAFGENMLLPLLHLESRPFVNPHVRIMVPTTAEISWRTGLGIDIGGAVRVDGGEYGLGEFGAAGRIDKLRYANVTAGPFLSFRLNRGWRLMLEGGGTVYRRFETWLEETKIDDYELDNASFFRIGLHAGI